jgi:hypothetical protein
MMKSFYRITGIMVLLAFILGGCASTPPIVAEPEVVAEPVVMPERVVMPEPEVVEEFVVVKPEPEPEPVVYTVRQGDTLWSVSGKGTIYGNVYQWPLIYKENSSQINDADLIYPGQMLMIDSEPGMADVQAAIRHAKTRGPWSLGVIEDSDRAYLGR